MLSSRFVPFFDDSTTYFSLFFVCTPLNLYVNWAFSCIYLCEPSLSLAMHIYRATAPYIFHLLVELSALVVWDDKYNWFFKRFKSSFVHKKQEWALHGILLSFHSIDFIPFFRCSNSKQNLASLANYSQF